MTWPSSSSLLPAPATLFLLIGLPGSGKSTIAASLQRTLPRVRVISTDAIRAQLFGDEAIQGEWALVQAVMQHQLQQALDQAGCHPGQVTLCDATHARRRDRRRSIQMARAIGFTHLVGLWLDTPFAVCLQRNQHRHRQVPESVLCRMHARLLAAPPQLEDGLDGLIRLGAIAEVDLPGWQEDKPG